jgi:hypothetical protein
MDELPSLEMKHGPSKQDHKAEALGADRVKKYNYPSKRPERPVRLWDV